METIQQKLAQIHNQVHQENIDAETFNKLQAHEDKKAESIAYYLRVMINACKENGIKYSITTDTLTKN